MDIDNNNQQSPSKAKPKSGLKIASIGAGYVGGPLMSVLASKHHDHTFVVYDINRNLIEKWQTPTLPVYEEGLKVLVEEGLKRKNLIFTCDKQIAFEDTDFIFICVNTPTKMYGKGKGYAHDLKYIESCMNDLALYYKNVDMQKVLTIIEKSTVPVKTCEMVKTIFTSAQTVFEQNKSKIAVLSNPEFIAQGVAIKNLTNPDAVIIGDLGDHVSRKKAEELKSLYEAWVPESKIITTQAYESELIKLAANSFLAQRVSSINSISAICEGLNCDVDNVSKGLASFRNIGDRFLKASLGFGGSCFEKDVKSLVYLARSLGLEDVAEYWEVVIKMNNFQKNRFCDRIISTLKNSLFEKKITLFGASYKKGTNDPRCSAALTVTKTLLEENARVCIYDPKVKKEKFISEFQFYYPEFQNLDIERITFFEDCYKACEDSHAIAVVTEWDEFRDSVDYQKCFELMKKPAYLFDGRLILDLDALTQIGFVCYGIGKSA